MKLLKFISKEILPIIGVISFFATIIGGFILIWIRDMTAFKIWITFISALLVCFAMDKPLKDYINEMERKK